MEKSKDEGNAYYEKQWKDLREKMKNQNYKQHMEWAEQYEKTSINEKKKSR